MSQETEKQMYENKAQKIAEKIASILKMESGDIITGDMEKRLRKIQSEAALVYQKLKNNEFEIAIVGLEKAGKSSFSNAFIENNLLPTDDQRCTYTATCIRYAPVDDAVVRFYGQGEFERDFVDKLKKIGIENAESYSYKTLTMSKYEELYEQRGGQGSRFDETLNEDIRNIISNKGEISRYLGEQDRTYREEELKQEEFQGFIKKPAQAIAVKEVRIGSKVLDKMKNAIIYDVPGFNSPTEMHKEQTLSKMRSADAIVMVAKGDEPSITGDVLKIFRESDNDGTQLKEKLFVFANKSDRASDFAKNQEITYEEWINRYPYVNESEKWRIVFGSANAHLQACGQIEGENFRKAVEEKGLPHGDGIEKIRTLLKNYNDTQRFEVLKRRINKLQEDLKDVFKEVLQEYKEEIGEDGETRLLTVDFVWEAAKKIPESLDEYRSLIRNDIGGRPLSDNIRRKIDSLVSLENSRITDEEIEHWHQAFTDLSGNPQPNKVDARIRSEHFREMYDEFSREVVKMVLDEHKKYEEGIIDRCLEAIGVKKDARNAEKVRKSMGELFGSMIGREESNYYQSLVERFSRDIYEILILNPYGSGERLNRFYSDMNNFYSLSIFYRPGQEDESVAYINDRIGDLPMCRLLLLHTGREEKENAAKACEQVKALFEDNVDELLDLVTLIGRAAPLNVLDIVAKVCLDIDRNQDARTRSFLAKDLLRKALGREKESRSIYTADIADRKNYEEQYVEFHARRRRDFGSAYDNIKQDFQDDVEILHDILWNAFVNAINIEKSFAAKEEKIIDDIKDYVGKGEFRRFLSDNMWLIKYKEYDEIEEREGKRRLNAACLKNIRELLNQID